MLFHLQFPFSDLRDFIPSPSPRLPAPSWPSPLANEEFVRGFGSIRKRPRGGLTGWIAESEYCDARNALIFCPGILGCRHAITPRFVEQMPLHIEFRRLYFDGCAVGKVEVGISPKFIPFRLMRIDVLINYIMRLKSKIPVQKHKEETFYLYSAGRPLARFFEYATSAHTDNVGQSYFASVTNEAPGLFIETECTELNRFRLPSYARNISIDPRRGFNLYFWNHVIDGQSIRVWCLVYDESRRWCDYGDGDPCGQSRNLRIYLLRLNAEHQTLKRVLKAVGDGRIVAEQRGDRAQILQAYLNEATRRIGNVEKKAIQNTGSIDVLALSLFDKIDPGLRDSLLERLRLMDIRTAIFKKVEKYTSLTACGCNINMMYVLGKQGEAAVGSQNNNFGNGDMYNTESAFAVGRKVIAKHNQVIQDARKALSETHLMTEDAPVIEKLAQTLASQQIEGIELTERLGGAAHLAALADATKSGRPQDEPLAGWTSWKDGLGARAQSVLTLLANVVTIAAPIAKLLGLPI